MHVCYCENKLLTKVMINKLFITLLILGFTIQFANSQVSICLGDDVSVCTGTPVQINNCGGPALPGGNSIVLNNPSQVNLTDDVWSGVIPIGFNFSFYGNTYSNCVIGSNCLISFNTAVANTGCAWGLAGVGALPNTGFNTCKNTAMLCYQDINPGTGGNIYYQTIGTAPNRMFVVIYANIPMFGSGECAYMSTIFFETSNNIEYHIANKPISGSGWNGQLAIQATENIPGNVAHATPGRNNTVWTATSDARLYTPTSPSNTTAYTITPTLYKTVLNGGANYSWQNTLGQTFAYNNGVLNIPSAQSGTVGYFLTLAGTNCNSNVGAVSDTSWVTGTSSSVSASSTPDICSAGQGTVTATPTGGTAPYVFNWPALGSNSATVSGVYGGTYQVQMTDAMGCSSTANVTVGDTPANYSSSSTLVSCPGGSDGTATANMIPAIGNITYLWDDPMAQTTQTAVGLAAGTYNCTITSDVGCSNTIAVTVTEIPGMIANFTTIEDVTCNSDNDGVLEVTVTQGTAPYSYLWSGSSSNTNIANDLYAGDQTVTITDANGCVISLMQNLTEPDSLKIANITPDTQICPEDDITLAVSGTGGSSPYTFTWSEGGNVIGTGTSIVVDPNVTNTQYTVVLSEQCGSPTDTRTVTITFPTPIPPMLSANKYSDCVPGEFEFENVSTNKAEIASTYIDFGDMSSIIELNGDSTSHTYQLVGTYSLPIFNTSIYGCVYADTLIDFITVLPNPISNFYFSNNPASVFDTEITVYEKATPDVVTWEWISPGSIPASSNLENPTFVFPEGEEGTYQVTLIVTSYHGCTDTLTQTLVVEDEILFFAPNSFTPDGDEFNQNWNISLKGTDVYSYSMQIFNRWGEMIWESKDPSIGWDGTYNGKVVQAGTYSWRASMKNKDDDGKHEFTGYINVMK